MTSSRFSNLFELSTAAVMTLAALFGCSSLPATPVSPTATRHVPLQLFPNPQGRGSLQVNVVDQRAGFQTQAIADADTWDQVGIQLISSKLPVPAQTTLHYGTADFSQPRQLSYVTNALGSLPPSNDYQLAVSLASGSVIVGQGASSSITVQPGATTSVTIYINTVGAIAITNGGVVVASGSPELSQGSLGFPEVMASSSMAVFPTFSTLGSTTVQYYAELDDMTGNPLASSSVPTTSASASLFVPVLPAGDIDDLRLLKIVGLDAANQVTTTKTRDVLIYRPATVNAAIN